MVSTRTVASSCLDLNGEFRIRRDVFGYGWGPLEDRSLSLRDHLSRISGPSIDITVILVGHEPGFAGWFDQDDVFQIQSAIDWARTLRPGRTGHPPHLLELYPDRRRQWL